MKNVAVIIVTILLGAVFLVSVMAVDGRSNREEELAAELPSCVEESVNTLLAARQYDINNRNEFVADLAENLSVLLDSDGDITVEVEQADEARGALSVRVTAGYTHPNGKRGQVSTQRTVLLNKVE